MWACWTTRPVPRGLASNMPSSPPAEITSPWRDHILTSIVKRYDIALSAVLRDYARGALTGGVRWFDLRDGATELASSGGFIDDIRPRLEDLRRRIVAGEIQVPDRPRTAGRARLLAAARRAAHD